MSEEVRKAKRAVPRVMFWTNVINGVLTYIFVLVLLYCMGSLEDALNTPTGLPLLAIFYAATGSKSAATAMMCGMLMITLAANLASIASTSRLTWAWARDKGLPSAIAVVSSLVKILCAILHATVRALLLTSSRSITSSVSQSAP